jgi:hypothetical protein
MDEPVCGEIWKETVVAELDVGGSEETMKASASIAGTCRMRRRNDTG